MFTVSYYNRRAGFSYNNLLAGGDPYFSVPIMSAMSQNEFARPFSVTSTLLLSVPISLKPCPSAESAALFIPSLLVLLVAILASYPTKCLPRRFLRIRDDVVCSVVLVKSFFSAFFCPALKHEIYE